MTNLVSLVSNQPVILAETPAEVEAEWEAINSLIGRVYDCALDPALWNDTLANIVDVICPPDWICAFILSEQRMPRSGGFVAQAGLLPGSPDWYLANFAADNPWSEMTWPMRNGQIFDSYDVMSRADFAADKFGSEMMLHYGNERIVGIKLDRSAEEQTLLAFLGPEERSFVWMKRGLRWR